MRRCIYEGIEQYSDNIMRVITENDNHNVNIGKIKSVMDVSINDSILCIAIEKSSDSFINVLTNRYLNIGIWKYCANYENNFPGRYRKLPIYRNSILMIEGEVMNQIKVNNVILLVVKVVYCWESKNK